jgi:hypothetical protein
MPNQGAVMFLEQALANSEDLIRLQWLECEGFFPAGYAARSTAATIRYLERIALLCALHALRQLPGVTKYPGPTVTE